MSLEERIADAVRTHTDIVTPPPTNVPGLLRRARRHRRTRAAGVICSAFAVGAVAVAVSIQNQDKRTDPPAVDRPHGDRTQVITRGGVTVVPDLRDEQVVVTPDIDPSDLAKEELLGWASTSEDEDAGATDLTVKARTFTEDIRWEVYCAGAPDLHYIFTIDPNATYFETGSCGGTTPATFPSEPRNLGMAMQYSDNSSAAPENLEARIFVTDSSHREYKQCYEYSPPGGCDDVEPQQASRPALSFGVAIYESAPPAAVRLLGFDIFGLTTVSGTDYMLDRAVAAPTASTLTYELAASSKERIVQTLPGPGADDELELRVDGQHMNTARPLIGGRGPAIVLEPGGAHEITVVPSAPYSEEFNLGLVVFEAVD
jgi:hypothetical protein